MSRNGSTYHRLLNTQRWRRLRAAQLDGCPLCADCRAEGVLTPATEVHHAVPVETARSSAEMARLAYEPLNLVSLCADCHHRRHREMRSHSAEENRRRAEQRARGFWAEADRRGESGEQGEGGPDF